VKGVTHAGTARRVLGALGLGLLLGGLDFLITNSPAFGALSGLVAALIGWFGWRGVFGSE